LSTTISESHLFCDFSGIFMNVTPPLEFAHFQAERAVKFLSVNG